MRPDDDDGPEMGGGPPPDPSMRAWRHPSEIAAAAAAAQRPMTPDRWMHPLLGRVAVLGAMLMVATASALVLGTAVALRTDSGSNPGVSGQAALLRPASSTTLQPSSLRSPADAGTDQPPAADATPNPGPDPAAGPAEATGESGEPLVSSSPTTSAPAPPDSPALETGPAAPTAWFSDEAALEEAYCGIGVYGPADDEIARLASFFVVDELVFTSSSALGGADQVVLLTGDATLPASVVGADDLTDVAVLALADGTSSLPAETILEGTGPATVVSGMPLTVTVPTDLQEPAAQAGLAIGDVRRTTMASGAPVYDLLLTTIRRPDGSSGAPVIDDQGHLVGMVADTPGYLTRVAPIDVVVSVGEAYLRWGAASEEWLGVEGASWTPSGAEILTIDPGSPAAGSGLRRGDVVTAVDGEPVADWHHLVYLVRQAGAGSAVVLDVQRGDLRTTIEATIGSRLPTGS